VPVGLGTGVAEPPAGAGVAGQVAAAGSHVGTGTGALPALPVGLGTGVTAHGAAHVAAGTAGPAAAPVGLATGAAVAAVPEAADVVADVVPDVAADVAADAVWPAPDAAAVQPAKARPAAIPSVQPAATRFVLLYDRTRMLLEVVTAVTQQREIRRDASKVVSAWQQPFAPSVRIRTSGAGRPRRDRAAVRPGRGRP